MLRYNPVCLNSPQIFLWLIVFVPSFYRDVTNRKSAIQTVSLCYYYTHAHTYTHTHTHTHRVAYFPTELFTKCKTKPRQATVVPHPSQWGKKKVQDVELSNKHEQAHTNRAATTQQESCVFKTQQNRRQRKLGEKCCFPIMPVILKNLGTNPKERENSCC